jgi:hypothetical protein
MAQERAIAAIPKRVTLRLMGGLLAALATAVLIHCGDENSQPSCDDLVRQAAGTRQAAVTNASLACERDEDCVVGYYRLDCLDDCGTQNVFASSSVEEVQAVTDAANQDFCQPFADLGCRLILNPCVAPDGVLGAVCRSGRCQGELTPFEPGN